jgi:transcriptional regulator with XRE-family HTH domain
MASEVPEMRIGLMSDPIPTRRRGTEQAREAERLTHAIALTLAQSVRSGRKRRQMTQRALAARVNVHPSRISQIEGGRGQGVPLHTWVALGTALSQPLAISFTRPLTQLREPADAGHLAMQERLLELGRATGRTGTFELPTRPADPWHSIDVCVVDPRHRVLIIQEAWNRFGDLGAATRSSNRKAAEAAALAAIVEDGPPYRVAMVWVVRATVTNRALIARYPQIFGSAFPGSSRLWVRAMELGTAPPDRPGLVWLDPASGRLTEWRPG